MCFLNEIHDDTNMYERISHRTLVRHLEDEAIQWRRIHSAVALSFMMSNMRNMRNLAKNTCIDDGQSNQTKGIAKIPGPERATDRGLRNVPCTNSTPKRLLPVCSSLCYVNDSPL